MKRSLFGNGTGVALVQGIAKLSVEGLLLGAVAVASAPAFSARKLKKMFITGTLRVMEQCRQAVGTVLSQRRTPWFDVHRRPAMRVRLAQSVVLADGEF